MKILKILKNEPDDYVFNILGIENFNKETSYLRGFFQYLKKNHSKIDGDICEFGTFNGKSALAIAIFLKKIKSKKKIYCFDSFSGFGSYHKYDSFKYLKYDKDIFKKHQINKKIRNFLINKKITPQNISTSLEFSGTILRNLRRKIKFLNLNNIVIVKGDFKITVPKFFKTKRKVFSVNMDCDLYEGYKVALPYAYNNLEKGGYVHLDEYYSLKFPGCKIACDEFFNKNKIKVLYLKKFKWEFPRAYVLKK